MNTQTNKSLWSLAFAFLMAFTMFGSAQAANGINAKDGVAIKGYDTVAYFTQGKAVKGNRKFAASYKGNNWYFSSQDHLNKFAANPAAYAPQYGGYCAFAASRNSIAPVDPTAWSIVNNKLYLNFSKSVRGTWKEDTNGNIQAADRNWPSLVKQVQ